MDKSPELINIDKEYEYSYLKVGHMNKDGHDEGLKFEIRYPYHKRPLRQHADDGSRRIRFLCRAYQRTDQRPFLSLLFIIILMHD